MRGLLPVAKLNQYPQRQGCPLDVALEIPMWRRTFYDFLFKSIFSLLKLLTNSMLFYSIFMLLLSPPRKHFICNCIFFHSDVNFSVVTFSFCNILHLYLEERAKNQVYPILSKQEILLFILIEDNLGLPGIHIMLTVMKWLSHSISFAYKCWFYVLISG